MHRAAPTLRPLLVLVLCWLQAGCFTFGAWEWYRPLRELHAGTFVDAALAPGDAPSLLLRVAFPEGDTQVVRVSPPRQELELLPATAMPASTARLIPEEPLALGGLALLVREDGRLEIGNAPWEWRLPKDGDSLRATELRGIWLQDGYRGPHVLTRLRYGRAQEHFVQVRAEEARIDWEPTRKRDPFPLAAALHERGDHAVLRITGATRLLHPRRLDILPDPAGLAKHIPFTVLTLGVDVLTLPIQVAMFLVFLAYTVATDGPIPPRP